MLKKRSRSTLVATAAAIAVVIGLLPGTVTAQAAPTNLGLNRPVTASGQEVSGRWGPELAFDGAAIPAGDGTAAVHNLPDASRWSANREDNTWIQVDLGAPATLEEVKVRWGNTFATGYSISGSANGSDWTPLASDLTGARAAWSSVPVEAEGIRHVRLETTGKSQEWSVSIWEIEVLGTLEGEIVEPAKLSVIPKPASAVTTDAGDFVVEANTAVVASGDAAGTAEQFASTLRTATGFGLPVSAEGTGISFVLDQESELGAEAYELVSGSDGVTVTASSRAGLFYGAQTLLQLIGPWSQSAEAVAADWSVPAVEIADEPRYEWRGYMLDVSRSFFPTDEVRAMIDQMAQYKMNVLHVHLSDDQGWRIAISNEGRVEGDDIDYTLLTSVGGSTAVEQARFTNLPGRTGFFTAEEFAELVAYADARNIAVIPEIDGPAHAQTMLHSIPQLNSANSVPQPAAGQETAPHNPTTSVGESTLDVHNEYTYMAMNQVFRQLVEGNSTLLHGERYLHIGGDESFSTNNADYRRYMDRVSDIVTDLDAAPVVWHEAMNQAYEQLPANTVIHHWNGAVSQNEKNHVNNRGGKIVMSPADRAYLPQTPGNDIDGVTWACGGACDINRFYNWDPTAAAGVPEDGVLGVEAPMWGEHVRSLTSMEGMIYPRLMVTAEVGWTPQSGRQIADFRERLTTLGTNLTVQGRNFYPSDGTWAADAVALPKDALAENQAPGEIAVASIPRTLLTEVSASLALGGETVAVDVSVERELLFNRPQFDGRQVNGLFRFSVSEALPPGTHTGLLTVTAHGAATEVDIVLGVVADEPEPSEGPTDEPTDKPTVDPTDEPTVKPTQTPAPTPTATPFNVYTTPGLHYYNGRHWWTDCEPYSQTERCRTNIWGTQVSSIGGRFVQTNGWVFNTRTYLPSPRAMWVGNPLAIDGSWTTTDGRQWRTECGTPATGSDGCRSYVRATVVAAKQTEAGWSYSQQSQWVLNNIVMFSN